jgi:hypothetical protein
MSLVTVTLALPDLLVSARLVAVTFTVAGSGRSAGAVYTPSAEILPVAALPPAMPFTLHVTPLSEVPVTVALKATVLPSTTELFAGATVT